MTDQDARHFMNIRLANSNFYIKRFVNNKDDVHIFLYLKRDESTVRMTIDRTVIPKRFNATPLMSKDDILGFSSGLVSLYGELFDVEGSYYFGFLKCSFGYRLAKSENGWAEGDLKIINYGNNMDRELGILDPKLVSFIKIMMLIG